MTNCNTVRRAIIIQKLQHTLCIFNFVLYLSLQPTKSPILSLIIVSLFCVASFQRDTNAPDGETWMKMDIDLSIYDNVYYISVLLIGMIDDTLPYEIQAKDAYIDACFPPGTYRNLV